MDIEINSVTVKNMEVVYTMLMVKGNSNTSSDNKRFKTSKTILGSEEDAREPAEDQGPVWVNSLIKHLFYCHIPHRIGEKLPSTI